MPNRENEPLYAVHLTMTMNPTQKYAVVVSMSQNTRATVTVCNLQNTTQFFGLFLDDTNEWRKTISRMLLLYALRMNIEPIKAWLLQNGFSIRGRIDGVYYYYWHISEDKKNYNIIEHFNFKAIKITTRNSLYLVKVKLWCYMLTMTTGWICSILSFDIIWW